MREIMYIDMDNVIVDFQSGIDQLDDETLEAYKDNYDEVPGIFSLMKPMPRAIEAVETLSKYYEVYVLSTAPWLNPSAWKDKIEWIHRHFGKGKGSALYKRLIISHHKNLNEGDYLIDDRTKNGVADFKGHHIHFGQSGTETWDDVMLYLIHMS